MNEDDMSSDDFTETILEDIERENRRLRHHVAELERELIERCREVRDLQFAASDR